MPGSDYLTYLHILNRWKRFILAVVGGTAVAAVIISFFLPKWYAARSTFLPPRQSEFESGLAAIMQGFSIPGLGGLGGAAGSESFLFLAILDSRTLREGMIREFDLMKVYKAKRMDDALKTHRTLAQAALTDEGILEVIVEDKDPKRAADMANWWVQSLDDFNRNIRMTSGKRTRTFVEGRLKETKTALRDAENELSNYQLAHKNAPLAPDISAAVDAGASLLARRMAAEVRVNLISDAYRESAPQLAQARAELAALDRQIAGLPPLAMEYARLLRDMKVQEQVFTLLTAQYEEAKIRETKDVTTIDVLDTAVPPERRVRPIRWLFCASLTLAAVVLSVGTVFAVEFLKYLKSAAAAAAPAGGGFGR